ncbi:MAG: hypothetical protein K6T66_01005 [Peptococcaceae bacterium]|nr:hypothetical protein [Peptococcaceae bacterium]
MDIFQTVKQVSIVDIVHHYIPDLRLRAAGRTCTGRCPWHKDKNPSLTVWPDSGRWKCWACGIGGDQVALVAKALNLKPLEAARTIARDFSLPVPGVRRSVSPEVRQKAQAAAKERELQAAFAAKVRDTYLSLAMLYRCINMVFDSPDPPPAIAWWVNRLPVIESLMDELMIRDDEVRRVEAVRAAREWGLCG